MVAFPVSLHLETRSFETHHALTPKKTHMRVDEGQTKSGSKQIRHGYDSLNVVVRTTHGSKLELKGIFNDQAQTKAGYT